MFPNPHYVSRFILFLALLFLDSENLIGSPTIELLGPSPSQLSSTDAPLR